MNRLEDIIRNTSVIVDDRTFDIFRSKSFYPDAFACIKDRSELTVIAPENSYSEDDIYEIQRGWKLITFDTVIDFAVVGFLAKVSSALANKNISIFAISSYSTDHILVREETLSDSIDTLKSLGFPVK